MNIEDSKLSVWLRESRATPALPPRFQENVWRRIESTATAPEKSGNWLDALAALILRPRLAFAGVALLLLTGTLLGAQSGVQTARHAAQMRYVAAVAHEFTDRQ